jgi:hypothetical protein
VEHELFLLIILETFQISLRKFKMDLVVIMKTFSSLLLKFSPSIPTVALNSSLAMQGTNITVILAYSREHLNDNYFIIHKK